MDYTQKMLRDDALKGKTIVVTGGGSGLGKAMTKYFMELGANVAITSRDLEKLKNYSKGTGKGNRRQLPSFAMRRTAL